MAADDGATDARRGGVGVYTITLTPAGDPVACRPDETVLSAILRCGAKVVFGCRGGGCGICKMRLVSGRVDHGRCSAAVLSEAEKRDGLFLSCQARPVGHLTVELTEANGYRRPTGWWSATPGAG